MIIEAKDMLWSKSNTSIIGKKMQRKDTQVRPEKEAHIQDIICALGKLDRVESLPCFAIDAYSLDLIPKSSPEELNNISLVDRLNSIESKFTKFQEILDKTICENIQLRDRVDKLQTEITPTYATTLLKNVAPTIMNRKQSATNEEAKTGSATNCKETETSWNSRVQNNLPGSTQSISTREIATCNNMPKTGPSEMRIPDISRRSNPRGRGSMLSNRLSRTNPWRSEQSLDRESTFSFKSTKENSELNTSHDGFMEPTHFIRKRWKEEQRRRKIITGKAAPRTVGSTFRGAPEPKRDLFVYRVDKSTTSADLKLHISDFGFNIISLECISNEMAKFKSFKLSVPLSEFNDLFNESIWPYGVRIRKYITPRSGVNE